MDREKLVAACGLYCGACEMYRADHDNNQPKLEELLKGFTARGGKFALDDLKCDGCLGNGRLTPWCNQCNIRLCSKQKAGEPWCSSDCTDFPCALLTNFANDGMTHHIEVLENLSRLQKIGIKKHAEQEEKRWLCPQYKAPMSWYNKTCHKCGAKRSNKLYKVQSEL